MYLTRCRCDSDFETRNIEIFGATLEEASLKKGVFFQLISALVCEVKRGFVDCGKFVLLK
jgi:hypothetical protein